MPQTSSSQSQRNKSKYNSKIGLPKDYDNTVRDLEMQAQAKEQENIKNEVLNKPAVSIKFNNDRSVSSSVTGGRFKEDFNFTQEEYRAAQRGEPINDNVKRYLLAREVSSKEARENKAIDEENIRRNIQGLPPLQTEQEKAALFASVGNAAQPNVPGIPDINEGGIVKSTLAKAAIGATGGALLGAPVAGIGAVPGAVLGTIGGIGTGLFTGFGKEKKQQVGILAGEYSDNSARITSLISNVNKGVVDPYLAVESFNRALANINEIELQLKEVTDGDLNEYLGDAGRDLVDIVEFQQNKQLYIQRMQAALANPNPNLIEAVPTQ